MDNESLQEAQDITNAMPTDISWEELEHMTDGFSKEREIGRGGYGVVYKGVQENGKKIAVKKLYHMPGLDEKQFQNEIQILTRLEHRNIVRLIGQTYKELEKCVEYNGNLVLAKMVDRVICLEYLHNGSLQKHLSDESSGLPWHKRYQIIKGICEGLNYLHEHSIFHLDLKPCNILLDDNMLPKIADFGLSRLFSGTRKSHTATHLIGTPGFMPPEYIEKSKISEKYDVFSLGVIIISIMTGPNGYSRQGDMTSQDFIELVHGNWMTRLHKLESGDATYLDAHSNEVQNCIKIALNCLEPDRHKRPSIGDIIHRLNESETTTGELNKQLVAVHTLGETETTTDFLLGFTKSVMEGVLIKAKSFITEDFMLRQSAHRDLQSIIGDFEMMHSILINVANQERANDYVFRTWVKQIRDLSYDVEDCIDFLPHQDFSTTRLRRMVPSFLAAAPLPLDEAVIEIQQLKAKVADVSGRIFRYSLISESGSNPVMQRQSPTSHAIGATPLHIFFKEGSQGDRDKSKQTALVMAKTNEASSSMGVQNDDILIRRYPLVEVRKSQMKDLRGYLARACVNGFPVISVWGLAGVGKSALVRNLYYGIMCHSGNSTFTKYSWVDVSHPFNLMNLAWSLLSELDSDSPRQNGISNPIQQCHELLEKHRCLVVIDSLQSTKEWDLIRRSLVSTHPRSIIVVITTEASIATHCANREEAIYYVKSLEDDQACDLFKKEVATFSCEPYLSDSEDPELRKLISKCGGLPKVIVAVADFLAPMTVNWMNAAINLNDRFMHDLETKPEFDNLRGLFGWMHNYFRTCLDYLKPCILYLSIFPQGHSIRRRRLVRRWISEGYSRDTSNRSAEDNGEKFFSMLLDLSIIQQTLLSVTTADTRMVLCQVNGFFHEYIISRQKDEDLVFELEGRCTLTSQRTGRHLVIKDSWDRDKIVFSSIDFSRLRSLTVFGEWKPFFITETMRVLRVLDLENATGVTYRHVDQMLKLLPRLKFLSLRGIREISNLPGSFAALRLLETLDVRDTSIVTLPPSITKLTKLQYIRAGTAKEPSVPCGVEVPAGIGKLTALHTLGAVNVGFSGSKAILKKLKTLTQLHKLEVTGINKKNSKEFCSAISDHVHLESLSLWLSMGNNQHFSEDMFSTQENDLEKLQSLKLYGPLRSVPAWMRDLPKLTKLELEVTMSVQGEVNNVLKVLGEITELRILRLCTKSRQDDDSNLDFCFTVNGVQDRCYLKVKVLEISCRSNLTVTFGSCSMENLELLSAIVCCSESVLKFTGLNNLSVRKLKEVRYLGSLDDTHKGDMEEQLNNHPRKPALNHVRPDGH